MLKNLLFIFFFAVFADIEEDIEYIKFAIEEIDMAFQQAYDKGDIYALQKLQNQRYQLLKELNNLLKQRKNQTLDTNNEKNKKKEVADDAKKLKFSDIAGYDSLKQDLLKLFYQPNKNTMEKLGLKKKKRSGLLLYGPPGNGKTMFVTALAGELGAKLIIVSPNFGDKYLNSGHNAVKNLFNEAYELTAIFSASRRSAKNHKIDNRQITKSNKEKIR